MVPALLKGRKKGKGKKAGTGKKFDGGGAGEEEGGSWRTDVRPRPTYVHAEKKKRLKTRVDENYFYWCNFLGQLLIR